MRIWTIAFAAGVLLALQLPELPSCLIYWLLIPVLWIHRFARFRPLGALLAGCLWCVWRADMVLMQELSPQLEGKDVIVTGKVLGIPENRDRGVRFDFKVASLHMPDGRVAPAPGHIRLSWYFNERPIQAGEHWRFQVRLKRPHGFANPGGFDYEFWLFQHRLRAVGYVRDGFPPERVAGPDVMDIHRLRHLLVNRINDTLDKHAHAGLVVALATGSRDGLKSSDWQVLQRTGTGHLLAISGLHVGIVAALFFLIGRWGWSLTVFGPIWLPGRDVGLVVSAMAAAFYAALAGFSVPTQRALVMVLVLILAGLSRRNYAPSLVLSVAALAVLVLDPFALHTAGFWLSFTAVAFILFGMTHRVGVSGWWWRWGRAQTLVAIGLFPMVLYWFQGTSLVSIPANLVAIPYVSILVVPLVLLGAAGLLLGFDCPAMVLATADFCLHGLWQYLSWLSMFDFAMWHRGGVDVPALVMAMAGALLLCLPRGVPLRIPGVLCLVPLLIPAPDKVPVGEMRFTLLDVGQGMSAVVETRDEVLVYDTGALFSERFNAGDAVLLPFLRQRGIGHVDVLVISHGDNDHIGGAAALLESIQVDRVLSSVPDEIPGSGHEHCYDGQAWAVSGVRFEMLNPVSDQDMTGNNASCVLRVSTGNQQILLTGDIERLAEQHLLSRHGDTLQSTVMTVPHHGSKTSSSPEFLDTVRPGLALVPAGYRNRYGFPKQAIMARYRERGITVMNTARAGAITIKMTGTSHSVQRHRDIRRRFWHSRNQ